jgi:hypothetical protein
MRKINKKGDFKLWQGFMVFQYLSIFHLHHPVNQLANPPKLKYNGCNICKSCFDCPLPMNATQTARGIVKQQLDLPLDI